MSQGMTYNVDVAMVLDVTASMSKIIETVKRNALQFHNDLSRVLDAKSKVVDQLRVRVIGFRDVYCDGDDAMECSPFVLRPQHESDFAKFVEGLRAKGGGDEPENGLEAVAEAIRSDWTNEGDKQRHVIVVYSDASVHPLEKSAGTKPRNYPAAMPANFDELTDMWDSQSEMSGSSKRIVINAPDAYAWSDIGTHWDNSLHAVSTAGVGLAELDYSIILDTLANSI